MENIYNVTEHLRKKIAEAGGNPEREILNFIPTFDNKYVSLYDGNYYRIYNYRTLNYERSVFDSKDFICLELRNTTYVRIDRLAYDEIEEEIKNKYPYISIGKGIINE